MSLSDLPDEILNLISIRLNGFDNCSLWMASDSKLKQRLVNNVITDIDIKYTIPGRYLWPGNFLKKLSKLSRLSLVVDKNIDHLPIQNVELFPIPTLKSLTLSFTSLQPFLQTHGLSTNHSTGPTTSSYPNYIDFNDYYGNLQHLKLISTSLDNSFSLNFFRFLPQKLKYLSMPDITLDMQKPTDDLNATFAILPQTLLKFSVWFDYLYSDEPCLDLSQLPPNLTSLDTNVRVDHQTYHMIPKNLKKLYLFANAYNIGTISPFLPTGLERLSILMDHHLVNSQMFAYLQNLSVISLQSPKRIKLDDLIINSPPKLKKFSCNNLDVTDIPVTTTIFNNNLTTLTLNNIVGITVEFISALPQSLTKLRMSLSGMHKPFAFFSHLPRNLKSLTTNFDIIDNTSLLPDSLTLFDCSASSSIHDSCFDQFPPKLESLSFEHHLPRSVLQKLPSTLTELYLASSAAVDDEIIRMLPRGLKQFTLNGPDVITDAGAADLPQTLETLILCGNTTLTDNGIASLPRTLMRLNLPQNPNLTDKCIKELPRKLITLQLSQATNITSQSCKDLPSYLATLYLAKCENWSPEALILSKDKLPQFIQSVNLGNSEANETWTKIMKDS